RCAIVGRNRIPNDLWPGGKCHRRRLGKLNVIHCNVISANEAKVGTVVAAGAQEFEFQRLPWSASVVDVYRMLGCVRREADGAGPKYRRTRQHAPSVGIALCRLVIVRVKV